MKGPISWEIGLLAGLIGWRAAGATYGVVGVVVNVARFDERVQRKLRSP